MKIHALESHLCLWNSPCTERTVNNRLIHQYGKAFYVLADQVSKLGLTLLVRRNSGVLGKGFSCSRIVCFYSAAET